MALLDFTNQSTFSLDQDFSLHNRGEVRIPEQESRASKRYKEGLAFKEAGMDQQALELFAEAAYLAPSNEEYHLALGQLEYDLGHIDEAVACFEHLTRIAPTNPSNWLTLGFIRFRQEDYKRAILPLSEAVHLDPVSADATYYLAESLRKTELYEESIPLYQKLLLVGTEMPQAVFGYSLSLLALGKLEDG
ncbi:MAG: tetratricopeptide repeat protein, partial [Thermoguttaceae bacterium]